MSHDPDDPAEFEWRWRREERIRLAADIVDSAIEAICFVAGVVGIILAMSWVGILR